MTDIGTDNINSWPERWRATLRFDGDGVPLEELAALPWTGKTKFGRKGERFAEGRTWETHYWNLVLHESSRAMTDGEGELHAALAPLAPMRDIILDIGSRPHVRGFLWIAYVTFGRLSCHLSPRSIRLIAEFGLGLFVEPIWLPAPPPADEDRK